VRNFAQNKCQAMNKEKVRKLRWLFYVTLHLGK
jgi:hypothetical protein